MQFLVAALLLVGLTGCQSIEDKNVKIETQQDSVSYSIGLSVGKTLQRDSITITPEVFLRGVLDAKADSAKRLMSDKEVESCMMAFQQEMQKKAMDRAQAIAEKNITDGMNFLAENANKPGVVSLPSGLQYKVITAGNGKKPTSSSTVKTHYRGRLLDGTEFDSSYKRNEPAVFPVSGVIPGWIEALQLMPVGSKWELYIPANLAYGEQGAGNVIPPNAVLIFEIELLEIQ